MRLRTHSINITRMSSSTSIVSERSSLSATNTGHTALDAMIWKWAEDHLGAGYSMEVVDMSKIKVLQGGMYYEGKKDWYNLEVVKSQIFNNDDASPLTCTYTEILHFTAEATWKIEEILDSILLPKCNIFLEFPCCEEGKEPLSIKLETGNNNDAEKVVKYHRRYDICKSLTVKGYSTVDGGIRLRTCTLKDVPFKLDVIFSGTVIICGHKKRKFGTKTEVKVDISMILGDVPGFRVVEGTVPGEEARCHYSLEGVCSGRIAVSVSPCFKDVQTLV